MTRQAVTLGVILEQRDVNHPWKEHDIRPVAVVPGLSPLAEGEAWRLLRQGEGWSQFHAATLPLELFAGETEGYRNNLANPVPHVYVVLTPGEGADDPEVIPTLVTVCPYEAERYMEDSEMAVEGVPMPEEIAAWLAAFVDAFHVEEAFTKRKQKKAYDPRKGDLRPRPLIEDGE